MTTTHPHTAFRESPERRAEGSRRPVRILLVEDDDDVRLLLTLVLKRAGYEVSATANADQALQALHRGRHDLILTDYCLPRKDGLEFLAEARSEGTPPARLSSCAPPFHRTASPASP